MKNIKAIIFDLDGTLLDTIDDLADSCNEVLEKLGYPTHKTKDYMLKVGSGAKKLVTRALPKDSIKDIDIKKAFVMFKDVYKKNNGRKTKPYNGICELLNKLSSTDLKLAVLSNKPDVNTIDCINDYFPNVRFDIIRGAIDGVPLKPAPDSTLNIIESFGIEKNEVLFIGDSNIDIETAQNAGITPIAVEWGFREREVLEKYGVQIVSNVRELEKFIFES